MTFNVVMISRCVCYSTIVTNMGKNKLTPVLCGLKVICRAQKRQKTSRLWKKSVITALVYLTSNSMFCFWLLNRNVISKLRANNKWMLIQKKGRHFLSLCFYCSFESFLCLCVRKLVARVSYTTVPKDSTYIQNDDQEATGCMWRVTSSVSFCWTRKDQLLPNISVLLPFQHVMATLIPWFNFLVNTSMYTQTPNAV